MFEFHSLDAPLSWMPRDVAPFAPLLHATQCRGVTRLDDARVRSTFGAPIFETEIFRKQICCIEESTCDIVGTFRRPCSHSVPPAVIWRPRSDSAPGELSPPWPPVVTPLMQCMPYSDGRYASAPLRAKLQKTILGYT